MKLLLRTLAVSFICIFSTVTVAAETLDLWFAPGWKTKAAQAKEISKALSEKSDINIRPRIASSYPQILEAFESGKPALVYVGSFVQAMIRARGLGEGLVQGVTGTELYSGVLIYPKDQDPKTILENEPSKIAFVVGASSGESSAKAATHGKASIKTKNHAATAGAVKAGKAKAGVVKSWWWEANSTKYPDLKMYEMPGISENRNPDNVLSASKAVPADLRSKIKSAAKASKNAFKAKDVVDFDPSILDFTESLMKKGGIDPKTYKW